MAPMIVIISSTLRSQYWPVPEWQITFVVVVGVYLPRKNDEAGHFFLHVPYPPNGSRRQEKADHHTMLPWRCNFRITLKGLSQLSTTLAHTPRAVMTRFAYYPGLRLAAGCARLFTVSEDLENLLSAAAEAWQTWSSRKLGWTHYLSLLLAAGRLSLLSGSLWESDRFA